MFNIRYFGDFCQLPPEYDRLVAVLGESGLFGDPDWFAFLLRRHFSHGDTFRLYAVETADGRQPLLLMPLRLTAADAAAPGARVVGSVSHPENFAALALAFDPDVADREEVLSALLAHLRKGSADDAPCDVLRLWPTEQGSPLNRMVAGALRNAGFWIQSYANSFNRFETTDGLTYEDYLGQRSANHRYNIRRRQRALAKAGQVDIAVHTAPEALASSVADYVAVARASWKIPPSMIAPCTLELLELAARKGCLRLGILRLDGVAMAAQFWIVSQGVAHCSRLAYREDRKDLAAGVVLTSAMIEHVLDRDHVRQLDFGYGDDDYKGSWMKSERHYFGLMAFNPATLRGLRLGLVQLLGRPVKRAVKHTLGAARSLRLGRNQAT